MGVNPCVMQAKVNRDGVYYWATDAEAPEGDYAYLALCHTDGEETTLVLDIDVPTNGAYPSKILSDYVVVTNQNPNEIFIANFRTGENGRFDGSSLTGYWFYQDEVTGSLYYYNNSTSTLYRAEINGSMQELGSFDEPVELLLIADSIIYYRNKSNGVAEALSLG